MMFEPNRGTSVSSSLWFRSHSMTAARPASFIWTLFLVLAISTPSIVRASPLSDGPWGPTEPKADPAAIVVVNGPPTTTSTSTSSSQSQVRFTVLTDRMIRIERLAAGGNDFEDRKTVAVINRKLPVPSFTHHTNQGILTLQTACLTLTYEVGADFDKDTLQVTGEMYCQNRNNLEARKLRSSFAANNNKTSSLIATPHWTWHYGDEDPGNLRGTIRTLDGQKTPTLDCSKLNDPSAHCEHGLISRSGYAIVNDTLNYALDDAHDWWDGPNVNDEDLYVLGHGHDYKAALRDYRRIGGSIPLIPRYAWGVWFSRWYDYTPADVATQVVSEFERHVLPLDVVVLDMNWHSKNDWTGYSWDRRLFPASTSSTSSSSPLAYLKHRQLAVTLNLHDADGVNPWEEHYAEMCSAVGCTQGERIKFSIVNDTVVYALEDTVLQPLEQDGVDFWWIDWQQGEAGRGGAAGGKQNPTIWTAHVRSTNANRRRTQQQHHHQETKKQQHQEKEGTKRNMVLSRFGGLGAHRYPVHFSGDVKGLTWDNLAYQPYFSMTATNVGAIWSHDIEGPSRDPELYTRWLQWGVVSGVMRFHDRGMSAGGCVNDDPPSCSVVAPWNVAPRFAKANYEALRLRGSLIPYLYTASYNAHRYGRWFITPMYYEWPEMDGAYQTASPRPDSKAIYDSQYLLGDDLLVAPVVKPANTTDGLARLKLWVPPGKWIGMPGGRVLEGSNDGSTSVSLVADLDEIPMFARAGAIIPSIPVSPGGTIGLAQKPYDELIWTVCLASGAPMSGSGFVYEDDGISTNYQTRNESAITTARYTISDASGVGNVREVGQSSRNVGSMLASSDIGRTLTFTASTTGKFYKGYRSTTIRLMNTRPPSSLTANGLDVPYSRFGGKGTWSYDSRDAAVVIELPPSDVSSGINVKMKMSSSMTGTGLDVDSLGFKMSRAILAKAALDEVRATPGSKTGQDNAPGNVLLAASSGTVLEYLAGLDSISSFEDQVEVYQKYLDGALDEVRKLSTMIAADLDRSVADSIVTKGSSLNRVARAFALLESALGASSCDWGSTMS